MARQNRTYRINGAEPPERLDEFARTKYGNEMAKEKKRGPGRPPRAGKAAEARFEIRLTGDDLRKWTAFADKQGITLAELVREGVELAMARGSTR